MMWEHWILLILVLFCFALYAGMHLSERMIAHIFLIKKEKSLKITIEEETRLTNLYEGIRILKGVTVITAAINMFIFLTFSSSGLTPFVKWTAILLNTFVVKATFEIDSITKFIKQIYLNEAK